MGAFFSGSAKKLLGHEVPMAMVEKKAGGEGQPASESPTGWPFPLAGQGQREPPLARLNGRLPVKLRGADLRPKPG